MSGVLRIQAQRFAASGLAATALHVVVATGFIRYVLPEAALANAVAFVAATVFSYTVNTLWSFSRPLSRANFLRFGLVSLVGLVLTTLVSGAAEYYGLHYLYGIGLVVCIVPPTTFVLHRFWTYGQPVSYGRFIEKIAAFDSPVKIPKIAWPIFIGICAFYLITGGKILHPENTSWLMAGDPATHWLGWMFFRNSPPFQWPVGANPDYGMDLGSSIVFTDSIPLLAFIFKPVSSLLPEKFQYIGLWILICFSLQAFFSCKILSKFSRDKLLPIVGSGFFIIAPCFLVRLQGHYALFGQWLLLSGIYLYFSRLSFRRWMVLISLASLIHAYLFAMIALIWLADMVQKAIKKEAQAGTIVVHIIFTTLTTTVLMWAAGYFMVGSGTSFDELGSYKMNILSLIDPDNEWSSDEWSRVVRDQKQRPSDNEGFNFLGAGIIFLVCLGFVSWDNGLLGKVKKHGKTIYPLMILAVVLFVYSLSNHIALGEQDIITYKIPVVMEGLFKTFRVSGRFFWPVTYLIYLSAIVILFVSSTYRKALTVCLFALCFQIFDSYNVFSNFKNKFSHPQVWSSPMVSAVWEDFAIKYHQIIYVPPSNQPPLWLPLADFAALHKMQINTGYFARINLEKEKNANDEVVKSIINNKLSQNSIYIFEDESALWRLASYRVSNLDFFGFVDGFRVLAPNIKTCTNCTTKLDSDSRYRLPMSSYKLDNIDFTNKGTGNSYLLSGWSGAEEWGTWSDGQSASLLLEPTSTPLRGTFEISIKAQPFISLNHTMQEVSISINGQYISTETYSSDTPQVKTIKVPCSLAAVNNGILLVNFTFKNHVAPKDLGVSEDSRSLAIGIKSISIKILSDDKSG